MVERLGDLNGKWAIAFKIIMAFLSIVLPLNALAMGYLVVLIYENRERIVAIEASRFTAKDGLKVWEAIREVQRDIRNRTN